MKHKQGEQTFYNPEMGLLWPPGDLYGHHSEQEHRASLLACTVTLDCFQLLLEEWTNCIWFLSTLKLTAIVRIVMILRNISPKLESFPPNCGALSAVTVSPPSRSMVPWSPKLFLEITHKMVSNDHISPIWDVRLLKWFHIYRYHPESSVPYPILKYLSHLSPFWRGRYSWLEMRIHIKSRLPEWPLV